MKVRNAVVGMKVQVKHDCRGYDGEFIKEGLVCNVSRIDYISDDYELRLLNPDIDDGFAWVNASDVRRYTEPTESPEPDEPLTKGTKVRVKSTVVGEWGEELQEGDVYILQDDEDISHDGAHRRIAVKVVAGSSAWSTQPKYFDVLPDEVPEEPQDDIQVGDSVLVGAEGAGNYNVLKEYAGRVCLVVDTSHRDDCVEISHPHVMGGTSYTSRKKYLTKVGTKPVRPNLSSLRVGDYIVANDTDPHLQEGVAYRVVQAGAIYPMIALHHSENAVWREGYCVINRNVAKILREVNDATPRMAKSGSESTCRSE